ncbi:hypothetical protein J19TS2_52730 [Cohnella xylanilytica]|uniref:methyl-accepting chemotaxis protein n=1 Tax=Cohnella xylanilytica TaxID=557555 RepID=UPI001B031503|nr:methyl-accepting chemotaxis protein [Cohnella xylanilytica]GIO15718.1 hypothetical protein J19TS2_52730 [Cohnella xylanilytica]
MKWKLSGKMIGSFLTVSLLMLALGTYAVVSLKTMNDHVNSVIGEGLKPTAQLGKIGSLAENTRVNMLTAVKNKDPKFVDAAERNLSDIRKMMDEYAAMKPGSDERQLFESFRKNWTDFTAIVKRNIQLVRSGLYDEASEGLNKGGVPFGKASENIRQLLAANEENISVIDEDSERLYSRSRWILIGVAALFTLLAASVGWLLGRSVAAPIRKISGQVGRVAAGDLTAEPLLLRRRDELGELGAGIDRMKISLSTLIRSVAEASTTVAAASQQLSASAEQSGSATDQIAAASQQLAAGAERQTVRVSAGSGAIRELADDIQRIASRAELVSATAASASDRAEQGNRTIRLAANQMQEIHSFMERLTQAIRGLNARSDEVNRISDIIAGIASQTNLLALNASIEAARAGEQGAGFAVVAAEVRKLAEQSESSAKDISHVIRSIQEETVHAVRTMDVASREVAQGIEIVTEAGRTFADIRSIVVEASSQIRDVSEEAGYLAEGTGQAVDSIEEIAAIAESAAQGVQSMASATEEQLASIEEIAASAAHLSKMAEELQTLIERFKV